MSRSRDIELAKTLGWSTFGSHADVDIEELDFAGTDDGGMPIWERPTVHPRCEHRGEPYDTITRLSINVDTKRQTIERVRHILSSGYGCASCAFIDLREAVGLDVPADLAEHEHL